MVDSLKAVFIFCLQRQPFLFFDRIVYTHGISPHIQVSKNDANPAAQGAD